MSAGIGWLNGGNYVSDFTQANCLDNKFYYIGWAKGSALLEALAAQKIPDAMCVPEHWLNLGDWRNGPAFVNGPGAKVAFFMAYMYYDASDPTEVKSGMQFSKKGSLQAKNCYKNPLSSEHTYLIEKFRTYHLSGLTREGNDSYPTNYSYPTTHLYHNTHRWQYQSLPTSHRSAVLLVYLNAARY